uniref:Putative secreted peptide n=1 Tax=Anopheles braziliensis TaxID=58242 RepID=A0A2M3ZXC6_9DIPT
MPPPMPFFIGRFMPAFIRLFPFMLGPFWVSSAPFVIPPPVLPVLELEPLLPSRAPLDEKLMESSLKSRNPGLSPS